MKAHAYNPSVTGQRQVILWGSVASQLNQVCGWFLSSSFRTMALVGWAFLTESQPDKRPLCFVIRTPALFIF